MLRGRGSGHGRPALVSRVELDHVAVPQPVVPSDVLSIESGAAPDAGVLERAREILVHEPGNVFHRLAAAQDERAAPLGRAPRRLGVDARDAQMAEQPGADLPEPEPCLCRDGEGWIAKPRDVQERPQLGLRIGDAVRLVGEEQRGKPEREGIPCARLGLLRRPGGRVPKGLRSTRLSRSTLCAASTCSRHAGSSRATTSSAASAVSNALASQGTECSGETAGRSTSWK